jgi:hypothetical protein
MMRAVHEAEGLTSAENERYANHETGPDVSYRMVRQPDRSTESSIAQVISLDG